jgi:hypothetical protein
MDGKATLKLRSPQKDNPQHLYHENYDVVHCEYSLNKDMDNKGRASSAVNGGNIRVALPMLPNDNIMSWVFDTDKKYNGEITINDVFGESLEKVYFEEARPVKFRLHYEPGDSINIMLLLTINAQRMIIGDAEYVNENR